jgi:hypothetical protein
MTEQNGNMAERMLQTIKGKGFTVSKFEVEKLKISKGYLAQCAKDGTNIGVEIVGNFLLAFPEINPIWIIFGDGMPEVQTNILDRSFREYKEVQNNFVQSLQDRINDLKGRIEDKDEIIILLKGGRPA